ncbi:MAG TPA: hypothetical protein VGC15_25005 [Acetobacteraceae bacterium]
MTRTQAPATPLLSDSDAVWTEAARREAVLRPLSDAAHLSRKEVEAAARDLKLNIPRVYGLLRVFRSNPVTTSLLPRKPGQAKPAAAQAHAVAAYEPVIEKARAESALSLGDYAQAFQAAQLPTPRGDDRRSRPSLARVLRYCKDVTATVDQASAAYRSGANIGDVKPRLSRSRARSAKAQRVRYCQ